MSKGFDNILLFTIIFTGFGFWCSAQEDSLEIWQIQGAQRTSPYAGQQVTTTPNIITAVGAGFFLLQSPPARSDQDPATSDGIYVAANQTSNRKAGDLVSVKGTVYELNGMTQIGQGAVQLTVWSTGESLPEPVALTKDFPSGTAGTLPELEPLEGMLVAFTGITTGPSDWRDMAPVSARDHRPFREPGIQYPGLPGLPVWDGNPEVFWFLPNALGRPNNRFIAANTPLSAYGPMVQVENDYVLYPLEYTLDAGPIPGPVREAKAGEITIGCFNTRRLAESEENFDQKARKQARYIVEMLQIPDLLALQEVGSASALSTLRFYIQQLKPEVNYTTYLLLGNDDIHLAFLVNENIFRDITVEQLGKEEILPQGGILFNRPPLLLSARLAIDPFPEIHILNLHLRSLLGIEGDNESFVKEKRHQQALSVAGMVRQLQNKNLLVVGDLNAYPFTDGYVDVLSQISGTPSLGAQYPAEMIVDPPLRILSNELAPQEQYSYVFNGSAQMLDHALAGRLEGFRIEEMDVARANADFPDAFAPNEQLVQRSSDHDGFVVFLSPDPSTGVAGVDNLKNWRVFPNPGRAGQAVYLTPPAGRGGTVQLIDAEGKMLTERSWRPGETFALPEYLPPGWYFLRLQASTAVYSKKLVVLPAE